ncbi:hypothetical protein IQ251_16475 [Saccharopolyspora sp. HNM0983]|uniref:DUF8129 domain-containing protein n=1 Tax=Saccharopolyspora montiporae TaxID=2781240 RepID=A0A929BDH8_9PSEU|nr:hypothetical protein [Saccharopolyspora sp. HNM0983]MBE9376048.1 hypothetical protein [Saccharopolyspora sp. HNM0983]
MSEQKLPLPDYDELPMGSLQHRVRALEADDVRLLLEHERAHADRVPVIELLTNRLQDLEQGAQPSSGDQSRAPEAPSHTPAGSPVTPTGPAEPGRPTGHGTRSSTGQGIEHTE